MTVVRTLTFVVDERVDRSHHERIVVVDIRSHVETSCQIFAEVFRKIQEPPHFVLVHGEVPVVRVCVLDLRRGEKRTLKNKSPPARAPRNA